MKFIIDVPEGITGCDGECPFTFNQDVCDYICENGICNRFNFKKLHIEELNDNK